MQIKNIFKILVEILTFKNKKRSMVAFSIFVGCAVILTGSVMFALYFKEQNNVVGNTSSQTSSKTTSSSSSLSLSEVIIEKYDVEKQKDTFLNALKDKYYEKIAAGVCGDAADIKTKLESVDIKSYSCMLISSDSYSKIYNVTLDITKSQNSQFPIGKSIWMFEVEVDHYAFNPIQVFYPVDTIINSDLSKDEAASFCKEFSTEITNGFKAMN